MDVPRLAGIAFDVLSLSSILVLLVLGMGIIVSMMGIFNLAHGELVLLGAFTVYLAHKVGLGVGLGIVLAPIVVGAAGLLLERSVVRHFYSRPISALLATWAVGMMIRESVRAGLHGRSEVVVAPFSGTFAIGNVYLSQWRVAIVLLTVAVIAASYLLLQRTRVGLQVRATLDNASLARASGIATGRVYALTFAFGSALAGLAGALIVPLFALYADLGVTFLVRSFLAVMVGGVGSFEGPILGAGAVGLGSGVLPWVVAPVLADALVFVIAIALMRFMPNGLVHRG